MSIFFLTKMLLKRNELCSVNQKLSLNYWKPLFLLSSRRIASKRDVSAFVTSLVILTGLNKAYYKIYSLRNGGATYLAKRGVPDYTIKMLGRWNNNALQIVY